VSSQSPPQEISALSIPEVGDKRSVIFRVSVGAMITMLVATLAIGLSLDDQGLRLSHAWLLNSWFVLSISVGAIFFVAIQHITRAGWSVTVRRFAEYVGAGVYVPVALLFPLLIALLVGDSTLFVWNDPGLVSKDALLQGKSAYLNATFFSFRTLIYGVIWIVSGLWMLRTSVRQDQTDDSQLTLKLEKRSAPILLAMGFVHPRHDGPVAELGVELTERGNVAADDQKYLTSRKKIFVAGDMRRGQSLVVWAIREGRGAARDASGRSQVTAVSQLRSQLLRPTTAHPGPRSGGRFVRHREIGFVIARRRLFTSQHQTALQGFAANLFGQHLIHADPAPQLGALLKLGSGQQITGLAGMDSNAHGRFVVQTGNDVQTGFVLFQRLQTVAQFHLFATAPRPPVLERDTVGHEQDRNSLWRL